MDQHFILVFHEELEQIFDEDLGEVIIPSEYNTFRVSTRKIEAFCENHSFEYGYVAHLVEKALAGNGPHSTGRKCSFTDTPDWFVALQPDENCIDPVKEFSYTVYRY